MDDNYFKRKGLDDFLKSSQHVSSFDELGEAIQKSPKIVHPDELLGHMLMESTGAKEGDSKMLGKLRDYMYQGSDVNPAPIKMARKLEDKALAQYHPDSKTIVMEIAPGNDIKKAGNYAHEVGHHLEDMAGKGSIPVDEFPDEKLAEFIKNNPKATDINLKQFMDSVKKQGMSAEAAQSLSPAASKELQVTLHHADQPRGFEMQKVYDIMKGVGKGAKKIGAGITKIGAKAIGPISMLSVPLQAAESSEKIETSEHPALERLKRAGMMSGLSEEMAPEMPKTEDQYFQELKKKLGVDEEA